ncbi:hypothetical protein COT97_04315 [Candidatus Falkowbacteria bacterium CG10_big_fil_rev_8_21_14_0_10_39_11]|uniref:Transposase IS200-like domain-containing protein n=1 Tax=Candidatus Falkowbacteria bacterium CG10_big_fil_rev_8_21_14_0_10_39_11 TaxID=1974565 RepID=A0A2H0V6F4_9BACT|nr:MAG: hypothetical protein COT97_04315 [Candidatus Falkowbacteria bacterium CG10_big_fil_rev_8_21_14_0_10_39_11]
MSTKTKEKTVNETMVKKYKTPFRQAGGTYFYSTAISGKKNIFVCEDYMDLLVNAFKVAEIQHDVKSLAYVIMPNHFYWIFRLSEKQDNPSQVYGTVKKEVTLEILKLLSEEAKDDKNKKGQLDIFQKNQAVKRSDPRKILWDFKQMAKALDDGRKYVVWEKKGKVFPINDEKSLIRNLRFVADAPIRDRWNLVEKSLDYPYLYVADEFISKLAV